MATNIPPYPLTAENSRTEEPVQPQDPDSSMTRYTPPTALYPPPPPDPKRHVPGRPADNRSRGPSFGSQQIPSVAPVPNQQAFTPPYIVQTPPPHPPQYDQQPYQQQPHYFDTHRPSITYADNVAGQQYSSSPHGSSSYMRPGSSQRRLSASSAHSRHSRDSHRSDHSRRSSASRSRDRRGSYDDYDDDDGHEDAKPRKHQHKRSKHKDEHRPTWGDTVFGIFDVVKSAFDPRDKY